MFTFSDPLNKIQSVLPPGDRIKLFFLFWMIVAVSLFEIIGIGLIPVYIRAVMDIEWVLGLPVIGNVLINLEITEPASLALYGAFFLAFFYLLKNLYLSFYFFIKKKYVSNRGVYLQDRLFRAYMTAPYTFYLTRNSSELLRNVAGEVKRVVDQVMLPMIELTLHFVMFTCIITMLIIVEPVVTVVTLVFLGGVGYLFLRFTDKKITGYGKEDKELRTLLNKSVLQGLGGFKDARMLGRERLFIDEYKSNANRSKTANIYLYVVQQLPKPIIETLTIITIMLISMLMVFEDRPFSEIVAILVLFAASAVKIMPIFHAVFSNLSIIKYNLHSADTVCDDLKQLEKKTSMRHPDIYSEPEKVTLSSEIRATGVGFSYPASQEQAIRDLSLTVHKGEAVAFVGSSGAGKTTLVDLILGLLEPQKGTISVDGFNIQHNPRGWQKNIGYVPQHIYLLDDTIRRNIAFGIPDNDIDEQKLSEAIEAAQLKELLERLDDGDQTTVGEAGVRLSGGQRQRIGIARALYNNPQLLVMDEATSALDNITERYVIDSIEKLKGDRTIIMIAHRLTTVKNCDRLFFLDEGTIVDEGSYTDLVARNRKFQEMSLESS